MGERGMIEMFAFLFITLPACPTEDSFNCRWNAATNGNGQGMSFVALGSEDDGVLIYEDGSALFLGK